jgi:ABC-2 type transport system ATP-binding protein
MRDEGKTIVFSSHILADVEMICDRVGILRRGQLVRAGPMHEVVTRRLFGIEILYTGAAEDVARSGGMSPRRVVTRPDGRIVAEVASQEEADRLVDAVRGAGGRIVAVTPRYESLEDVFLRMDETEEVPSPESKDPRPVTRDPTPQ